MVILDTYTLLWLAADQSKLTSKAKGVIAENAGSLFVSSITAFEIAINVRKGRLGLPMRSDEWFRRALEFHGIREIPINSNIAFQAVQLPVRHNDPCDRFIIATARIHDMAIVTADENIRQYREIEVIW